eukprot:15098529-Alexandrium_andersonii.AAC.1
MVGAGTMLGRCDMLLRPPITGVVGLDGHPVLCEPRLQHQAPQGRLVSALIRAPRACCHTCCSLSARPSGHST